MLSRLSGSTAPAFLLVLLLCAWRPPSLYAQDAPAVSNGLLGVFLDCQRGCPRDFIQTEITFVNYVRDRTDADVHLLVTTNNTGSGGTEYTLQFIGLADNEGVDDELIFASSGTDTWDEQRSGLVQAIKLGLTRYVARTPLGQQLEISYTPPETPQVAPEDERDPWNKWIFAVGANGRYSGESSRESLRLRGNLRADRVTEALKFRMRYNNNYTRNTFDLSDTTIVALNRNQFFWTTLVGSINDHWSVGGSFSVNTSSFDNTDLRVSVSPAIEYNIFPYSEATRREFRIEYRMGLNAVAYEERTIFDKTSEELIFHELAVRLEINQPWGSADMSLEGFQFLHDFEEAKTDFYSVELGGDINVRIIRGLSFSVGAEISWIRDQLSLPQEDTSEEDILLQTVRLATDYEYEVSMGFNYTFGSIFNNVVNPRFGF